MWLLGLSPPPLWGRVGWGGIKGLQRAVPTAVINVDGSHFDVVVAGRPSERWGQEVVAVVQIRVDKQVTESDLLAEAGKHVARYKLPKAFVFRDAIVRSPSGKADYRWAKQQVEEDA